MATDSDEQPTGGGWNEDTSINGWSTSNSQNNNANGGSSINSNGGWGGSVTTGWVPQQAKVDGAGVPQ